jgi:hypothetical protein
LVSLQLVSLIIFSFAERSAKTITYKKDMLNPGTWKRSVRREEGLKQCCQYLHFHGCYYLNFLIKHDENADDEGIGNYR